MDVCCAVRTRPSHGVVWCEQSHRGETLLLQVDKTTTAKQIKELMEVGKLLPLRTI